jgi:hypothetical protein
MMPGDSIRLSEQHGVNPSMMQCFFCTEEFGVALLGKLKDDAEAPRKICFGPKSEPCPKCEKLMEMGVIFVSVKTEDAEPNRDNPYRTGGWIVLKEEGVRRLPIDDELKESILKSRFCFIPDDAWEMLGFPHGEMEGVPNKMEDLDES